MGKLVLTRNRLEGLTLRVKPGQAFVPGEVIEMAVTQIRGTGTEASIRIAIEAPEHVEVLRDELLEGGSESGEHRF